MRGGNFLLYGAFLSATAKFRTLSPLNGRDTFPPIMDFRQERLPVRQRREELTESEGDYKDLVKQQITVLTSNEDCLSEFKYGVWGSYLFPPISPSTRVSPVVVSRSGLPSGLVDVSECPVVTQDYFARVLRESEGDLARVLLRLPEPIPEVPIAQNVTPCHQEVPFGANRFLIPFR